VQNAFVRAMEYWPTYNPSRGKIENWFSRILINECYKYLRKDKKYNIDSIDHHAYVEDVDYNDILENYYTVESLISGLDRGPIKSVLTSIYLRGYTIDETSKMCRTSESNVKQICWRFREGLKDEGV
jgi:RNA polymerase sigma factor (sigma-70 family)